jgi:hypothetical protein
MIAPTVKHFSIAFVSLVAPIAMLVSPALSCRSLQ